MTRVRWDMPGSTPRRSIRASPPGPSGEIMSPLDRITCKLKEAGRPPKARRAWRVQAWRSRISSAAMDPAWRKANAGHVSLGQLKVMSAHDRARWRHLPRWHALDIVPAGLLPAGARALASVPPAVSGEAPRRARGRSDGASSTVGRRYGEANRHRRFLHAQSSQTRTRIELASLAVCRQPAPRRRPMGRVSRRPTIGPATAPR